MSIKLSDVHNRTYKSQNQFRVRHALSKVPSTAERYQVASACQWKKNAALHAWSASNAEVVEAEQMVTGALSIYSQHSGLLAGQGRYAD